VPEPAKLESVPPVAVMSLAIKFEEDSLRVKVMLAVWPDLRVLLSEVIEIVGAMVSARVMLWVALVNPDEAKVSV